MITVNIEGGPKLNFPDGTSKEVIDRVVQSKLSAQPSDPSGGLPPLSPQQQEAIKAVPDQPPGGIAQALASRRTPFFGAVEAQPSGAQGVPRDRPPSFEQQLGAAGIQQESFAGPAARAKKSLGQDRTQAARIALQQQTGEDVTVGRRPEFGGRLTGINPQTGQEQPFNAPGADIGDITGSAGPAVVAVPEAIGDIGGTILTGNPLIGLAAGAVGAGGGEAARLKLGEFLGVNPDLTTGEVAASAGKEAGLSALFGSGTFGAGKVLRRSSANIPGTIRVPKGVAEDFGKAADESLPIAREAQEEFKSVFGTDLPLRTDQTIRATDQELSRELEAGAQAVGARASGVNITDLNKRQARAIDEATEQVLGPVERIGGRPTAVAGRKIQNEARRGPAGAIRKETADFNELDATVARQEEITAVTEFDAGAEVRTVMQTGRDNLLGRNGTLSKRYDAFEAKSGPVTVDLSGFNAAGRRALTKIDKDILPTLSPEDRNLVASAVNAGRVERQGLDITASGPDKGLFVPRTGTEQVGVDMEVVLRATSDLKAEKRMMEKGISPRRNIKDVNDLLTALEESRAKAFADRPELLDELVTLEADYALAKSAVDRDLVGSILTKVEGGGFKVEDSKIADLLLGNRDAARRLSDVLSDPQFQFVPGARVAVEDSLLARLKAEAVDVGTNRLNRGKYQAFLKKHGTNLEALLGADQFARVKTVGGMLEHVEARRVRLDGIVKDLNKSYGMKMQKFDPSEVLGKIWKGVKTKPEDLRRLRSIVGRDPVSREETQKAILAQIRSTMTSTSSNAPGELSYKPLFDLAARPEVVKELGILMGTKWRRGFETLTKAIDFTRMRSTDAAVLREMAARGDPATLYQAVSRIIAAPLTREGRALTGALNLNRQAVQRSLDRIIADPELMGRLARFNDLRSRRNVIGMFEAVGLSTVARTLREED